MQWALQGGVAANLAVRKITVENFQRRPLDRTLPFRIAVAVDDPRVMSELNSAKRVTEKLDEFGRAN